jgi:hypothetical protein
MIYEIRVKGHLAPDWSDWFGHLALRHYANGETVITGPVRDQAALFGLLIKMRDLGLTLISVNRIESI